MGVPSLMTVWMRRRAVMSAWVSENQGDSWTVISAHLSPVYGVRFG
jgi:hypothetical protein